MNRTVVVATCLACGLAASAWGQTRSFMVPDGSQGAAPSTGNTTITLDPGTSATVAVWMEVLGGPGQDLEGYQVIIPDAATAQGPAVGQVTYVDNNPGGGGGDSIVISTNRPDWVFSDQIAVLDPVYNETPGQGIFGVFYATIPGFSTNPGNTGGILYLCEFQLEASADACGEFELPFNLAPADPPLTGYFSPGGGQFIIDEFQPLTVLVGPPNGACVNAAAVAEGDNDFCISLEEADPDVWFEYSPQCDGPVTLSTCDQADFNTTIEVYQGCGVCPPNNLIASNDDGKGCGGGTSEVTFEANDALCYTVRVLGPNSGGLGTGTLSITSGSCFIDGSCQSAGMVNPGNECEVCDPAQAGDAWSPIAAGTGCTDDGFECTDDVCDGAGTCSHPPLPVNTACTDDGEECTDDVCDGAGSCVHPALPLGTACSSDGNACTANVCDGTGFCSHPPLPDGTPCDDGNVCTGTGAPGVGDDVCDGMGTCMGELDPNCQDTCNNAAEAFEGATNGTNAGFGTELQVSCAFNSTSDAWFFYVATCDGNVKFTTTGSDFDTVLTLYDDCGGPEVACDDDGGPGSTSAFTVPVIAGEDYFIRVAGFNGAEGSFVLNINRTDTCLVEGTCYQPGAADPSSECLVCEPLLTVNAFSPRPRGTACGNPVPEDAQCDAPDACDGQGLCDPNYKPLGNACGDPTQTECNNADICDGQGLCDDNFQPGGTPCGDPTETECNGADTCDGSGMCQDNFQPDGTSCGDQSATACDDPDSCDGLGACDPRLQPDGTPCPDGIFCNGDETCDLGVCVDGDEPCRQPRLCDEDNDVCLECLNIADCGDIDPMDGVSDDNCKFYECIENLCFDTDRVFADLGGPFGACPIDGVADNNDRFHALNCFADTDTSGPPSTYPCEDDPPNAINVDAGGPFGSCCPDGVCDNNDAFAALNAFDGTTTCACPGACPPGPAPYVDPQIVDMTTLILEADRTIVRAGDVVRVQVLLGREIHDLRGYQLHLDVAGGRSGALHLIDISVADLKRQPLPIEGRWEAFNLATHQMLAGTTQEGVRTPANAYLATFTYRASPNAAGRFVVDVLVDDPAGLGRTFLTPTKAGTKIEVTSVRAATITVQPGSGISR